VRSMEEGRTRRGIAFTVRGSGPALLWLPGYVIPARAFHGVVDRFAEEYTCITVDHRGSGRSRLGVLPVTTASMAADAVSVLDELSVDRAHVVGASLGGMVAQELAIRHPGRVLSVALVSTTAGGVDAQAPSVPDLVAGLRRAARGIKVPFHATLGAVVVQGWAASTHDAAARVSRIAVPTLVLHGTEDELVPGSNAELLAARIAGAELTFVRGAGHLLLLDADTGIQQLRRWLSSQETRRPVASGQALPLREVVTDPWRQVAAQTLPLQRLLSGRVRLFR